MTELKKGARVTGEARQDMGSELRKRYESGESVRQLSESTGRSYGFTHRMLKESGAEMRRRGGAPRRADASSG